MHIYDIIFSKSSFKLIVAHALRELNIKATWSKDKGNQIVHYTYQGGHFNILLEKDSPYARLTFLFFYQAELEDIELVRTVCNMCNLNTDACRIVYTVDKKSSKVDVHLISVLPVSRKGMKEMLERVMGDAFRWQNTFTSKFEDLQKTSKNGYDKEKHDALYENELQIIHEEEMTHQEGGPDWHEDSGKQTELRSLLSTAMGLSDIIPIKLVLVKDDDVQVVDDPDDILTFPISQPLIEGNAFVHQSATGRLDFYDPRDPVTPRKLMLDFSKEESTSDTLFYRVTMALVPVSLSLTVNENSEQHSKEMTSVLLGYDLTSPEERQAQFRYIRKEALGKLKAGEEESMTDDEKLIAKLQKYHFARDFIQGRTLFLHRRYYEALQPLTNLFRNVSRMYNSKDRDMMDLLDEVAYFIGSCYMGLHQYDRASYYLQLTLPTTHQSYSEAYINCLVNGGDYRAMPVINGLLSSLQMMLDHYDDDVEEDDEDDHKNEPSREHLERFIAFIKRRKAYMLVNMGRYDEAERLLKQLLDDPDNSDFALNELAYIQKKSNK